MNSTNQGLKFGFFDGLEPEDQQLILNSLRSGSARLELYWEKPATRIKCHLPRPNIATKTSVTTTATQTTLDAGLHNKTEPEPEPEPAAPPQDAGDGLPLPPLAPKDSSSKYEEPEDPSKVSEPVISEDLKPGLVRDEPKGEEKAPVIHAEELHPTVEPGNPAQLVTERCDPVVPREKPIEEKIQIPTPDVIDNYFPPPPPDYMPPPPPQPGVPGIPHDRSSPSTHALPRSHQPDYNNVQRRSECDQQQVRGHVEDGIYTRPASSSNAQNLTHSPAVVTSPMNNSVKPYERRNKKRRPPDYYKRFEQEGNPTQQVPQVVGNMPAYHQVPAVSVRQAMESSSATGAYVGLPGAQQASVMSSQYGQHIPVSYPLIPNMMNSMQAVQQMQMLQRHQHQQQVQATTTHQYLVQQQQEMARMMGPGYPYAHLPHVAQNPVFHQPQVGTGNHGNMAGMAQPALGRPLAMSPSGLSPSMQPQQIGRSPPRGPQMATQQYQDPRQLDHHGYHQQHPQASPNVPLNQVPQVAIQSSLNSNNSYNQSSANPVHKDVARTGGQRMPVNVMLPQQPPQNLPSFAPPLQPHIQMQQQLQPQPQPQPVPHKVAATPPHSVPTQGQHKIDTQHQGMGPGNQKPAALAPQPDVKPVSPEAKEQAPVVGMEAPPVSSPVERKKSPTGLLMGHSDNKMASTLKFLNDSVNIIEDTVIDKEMTPQTKSGDIVSETKKDKDERTSVKASFSGQLTFGTVQDIATMNAQSTEVGPKFKTNEEPQKTESAPSPPKPNVIPKSAPKTQATAPVVSVETIKAVAEPVEEFHDAPLPPEDLGEKPVVQAQTVPVVSSGAAVTSSPTSNDTTTSTTTKTSTLNSAPVTNSSAPSSVNKQNESNKQSETKLGAPEAPLAPAATEAIKPKVVWASLFKNESKPAPSPAAEPKPSPVNNAKPTRKSEEKDDKKPVPIDEDSKARKLGEFLSKYVNKYSPVSLQPRGLYNRSNWCYINAALLACPAFYQLMKAMPNFKPGSRGPTSTPVIDCMSQFVSEFTEMAPQNLKYIEKSSGKGPTRTNTDIRYGQPFEPVNVLKMLDVIQSSTSFKLGRQEDAEEFLGVLLNALHEEMVACINITRNGKDDDKAKENGDVAGNGGSRDGTANENEDDEDQWEQVGPKNKSVVTRSAKLSRSPISETFGGQLRSTVHQQGHKESCTLQPFFSLQLDIQSEKVTSVPEALEALASKETLHGYTNDNKQEVEAYRRYTMDELPPVLILHLKCFIYQKTGGAQKVSKQIDVPMELNIGKDLMSANAKSKYSQAKRNYELFSVVKHHGMRAIGGHYTADIYHSGIQGWVHLDDSQVQLVSQQKVMQYEPTRFPYLLYYRRKDLN